MAIYSKKSKSKQIMDKNVKLKIGIALTAVFGLLLINLMFGILSLINSFFLGTFGLLTYAIFVCGIIVGVLLILNKSYTVSKLDILFFAIWMFFFVCMLQCCTTTKLPISSYGSYLSSTYSYKLSAGGIIFSLFTYPLIALTHTFTSAIVINIIAIVATTTVIVIRFYNYFQLKKIKTVEEPSADIKEEEEETYSIVSNLKNSPISNATSSQIDDSFFVDDEEVEMLEQENKITELTTTEKDKIKAKNILGLSNEPIEDVSEDNKRNLKDIFKATDPNYNSSKSYVDENRPPRYVHDNATPVEPPKRNRKTLSDRDRKNLEYLRVITGRPVEDIDETETPQPSTETPKQRLFGFDETINEPTFVEPINQQSQTEAFDGVKYRTDLKEDIYDENLTLNAVKNNSYSNFNTSTSPVDTKPAEFKRPPIIKEEVYEEVNLNPIQTQPQNPQPQKMAQMVLNEVATEKHNDKPKYKKPYHYNRPPIDLLNIVHNQNTSEEENRVKGQMLEETLESFKTPAKIVSIKRGPAFSRFEMQMPTGIPVNKIQNYSNDIAMAVQANGSIRMEIPIPGRNTFGIEVPNTQIDMVGIRDIIESNNFMQSKSPLTFALGKDIAGDCKVARLEKLIHLLVAGATGSGKSVCLNTMLISFLYNASPEDLKLILVDPKQVEFSMYKGIPHLLIPEIITDADKAVMMLEWACTEMDKRYALLRTLRARNITEYNQKNEVKDGLYEKMPYLVIVLDEVGDLMLKHKKEIEDKIVRLGQLARAAGIHLVLATQRPSVDIITGTIKANLPSRIAFQVTAPENSKTIIGCGGAENLLGRGDMLFSDQASPDLKRIQGAYVSDTEIENVVRYVIDNNECIFDSEIEDAMFNPKSNGFSADSPSEDPFDPLLKDALRIVIRQNKASISSLQRQMGIGFNKAGRLVDQMEKAGFISSPDSKNNRVIFISQQEFEERFGEDL